MAVVLLLLPVLAHAQGPATSPPGLSLARLSGTYRYTAYTVFDTSTPDEPTRVAGVGGTLALLPDGRYAKRLELRVNRKPLTFAQDGTWELRGDSIRFAFRDQKGADVQRGLVRLDTLTRRLTITILGYPVGNQGVYELEALPAVTVVPAPVVVPEPVIVPAPVVAPEKPKPLPNPGKRRRVVKVKSK